MKLYDAGANLVANTLANAINTVELEDTNYNIYSFTPSSVNVSQDIANNRYVIEVSFPVNFTSDALIYAFRLLDVNGNILMADAGYSISVNSSLTSLTIAVSIYYSV